LELPDFPWDSLAPYVAMARAHDDGIVDLSVGTPVDPVPAVVQAALAATTDTPGYPATYGTAALREAAAGWLRRRHGVTGADPANVLPIIGAKELVAWLPTLLGLGAGDVVWDCEFRSAEECAPHVIAGNRGFCNINPSFVPPPYAAPIKHRKRHS
jgi:aspartate/methionine/tyrosine aminotransferase